MGSVSSRERRAMEARRRARQAGSTPLPQKKKKTPRRRRPRIRHTVYGATPMMEEQGLGPSRRRDKRYRSVASRPAVRCRGVGRRPHARARRKSRATARMKQRFGSTGRDAATAKLFHKGASEVDRSLVRRLLEKKRKKKKTPAGRTPTKYPRPRGNRDTSGNMMDGPKG